MGIPTALTRIQRVAISTDGAVWVGAREGVYFTRDKGKTWMWVHRLPIVGIDELYYDAPRNRILVSSRAGDVVYAIDTKSLAWKWMQTGYALSQVRVAGDRVLAVSLDDGVLAEPQTAKSEVGQK